MSGQTIGYSNRQLQSKLDLISRLQNEGLHRINEGGGSRRMIKDEKEPVSSKPTDDFVKPVSKEIEDDEAEKKSDRFLFSLPSLSDRDSVENKLDSPKTEDTHLNYITSIQKKGSLLKPLKVPTERDNKESSSKKDKSWLPKIESMEELESYLSSSPKADLSPGSRNPKLRYMNMSDSFKLLLVYIFVDFNAQLNEEPENIALLFYLAIISYFLKTPKHSMEYLKLIKTVFHLDYKARTGGLAEYYYARTLKLQDLMK